MVKYILTVYIFDFHSVPRMLVQFGMMRGLIRHLQKYPVLVRPEDTLPQKLNHLTQ